MLSLFILSTLEGWPEIMYYFIDANDPSSVYLNIKRIMLFL